MKRSDTLRLEMSSLREKINAILEGDAITDETRAELAALTTRAQSAETEYRAAIVTETEADTAAGVVGYLAAAVDPEEAERRALIGRARMGNFIREAISGSAVQGADNEMRQSVLGDAARPGLVPFEMLDTRADTEHRADAVTPVAAAAVSDGTRGTLLERIFQGNIAQSLGVAMPAVAVGDAVYPVMTAGTAASMAAKDAAVDAAAGTFTGETLAPVRLSARYLFRVEDMYSFPGLEDVLRRDIRRELSDEMDNQMVNGDGNAPNVSGFLNELPGAAAVAALHTFATATAQYYAEVDGITATAASDLGIAIGPESYGFLETLYRSAESDVTAYDRLAAKLANVQVTNRLPAKAAKVQKSILARIRYPGQNAVAPVWSAFDLIRDNVTQAAKGQIAITAIMLWNFKIVRENAFKLLNIRIDA